MAAANTSDELDYETWAPVAKTTLMVKGLWDAVENGVPPDPSKIPELAATIQPEELSKWRDLAVKDMKALQVLQTSLTGSAFRKTLSASSAKDVWDLLRKGNEQAELSILEKQFEEISMEEGETLDFYIIRVTEIVEQLRRLNSVKSDSEVTVKVLKSVSRPYNIVAPILEEHMDPKSMTLESIVEFFDICDEVAEEATLVMLKDMSLESKSDKWCGVCNKNNHNQEECYSSGARQSRPGRGKCFQCGERGHYVRDCKRKNQTEAQIDEEEEIVVDYVMVAPVTKSDLTYDEDTWMVSGLATIHMTPYEKVFTTLDRTHKARVGLVDGKVIMVEGKGDVKIVMKEGKKKTINNVLFVPGIDRNVLSLSQMTSRGCSFREGGRGECIISDRTGAVYGETMWDVKDLALRLQVIKGDLTS